MDKDSYAHDLKDFSFTFIELPKFKITDINLLTNIIEKWCFFFKHADKTSEADLRKIIGSDQVIERAYDELNQFNWTEEELLTYEQETKRIMDNKASEDYLIKTAKAEGIQIGKSERNIEVAKNLKKAGVSTEIIFQSTGLTKEEIKKLE
ncbi:Rpn family recombination-promoting nuclease/putative transposase [Candidatus Tisiphia endosymbiont of Parasteatoda lunata]|uniref:Rpn family recombination-promoting nuclease/putative transposase n=1 Tax=Candidatus Tisiphia endosymbiont of Parasteatoda lunata TaxID=3066275 RepID=UPI003977AB1F